MGEIKKYIGLLFDESKEYKTEFELKDRLNQMLSSLMKLIR